jgi:hypothetical protein
MGWVSMHRSKKRYSRKVGRAMARFSPNEAPPVFKREKASDIDLTFYMLILFSNIMVTL